MRSFLNEDREEGGFSNKYFVFWIESNKLGFVLSSLEVYIDKDDVCFKGEEESVIRGERGVIWIILSVVSCGGVGRRT